MTNLMISLPRIDEEWVEENISQLVYDGIEILHMTRPEDIALSIGCTEFGEVFNDLEDHTYNNFYEGYPNEYEKAEEQSTECARYLFDEYGVWDRQVCTMEDITNYNTALKELIFQIAENFGHAWVQYLSLPYDEDNAEVVA